MKRISLILAMVLTTFLSACAVNQPYHAPVFLDTFNTLDQALKAYQENKLNQPLATKKISELVNDKAFKFHLRSIEQVAGNIYFNGFAGRPNIIWGKVNEYEIVCQFSVMDTKFETMSKTITENPSAYPLGKTYTVSGKFSSLRSMSFSGSVPLYTFELRDCDID